MAPQPCRAQGWEDPEAAGYDPYYEARDVQWPEERGGDEEGVPGRADWYLQQVAVGESFEAARRGMTTESDDWGDVFAGGEGPGPNLYSDGAAAVPVRAGCASAGHRWGLKSTSWQLHMLQR